MMKKIKKTILIVLISFSSFIFLGGPSHGGSVSGGDSAPHSTGADSRTPSYGSSCDSVRCGWSYSWQHNSDITIEMKDMNGNIIEGNIFDSRISKEFLAGTYVMLRVYEAESFNSAASYFVSAKRQVWTCYHYEKKKVPGCVEYGPLDTCKKMGEVEITVLTNVYEKTCACNGDDEARWKGWMDVTGEYIASCASNVQLKSYDLEAMYEAEYRDSNDVNGSDSKKIPGHECSKPVKTEDGKNSDKGYSNYSTLTGKCTISYDREADICINVKNGNVRYLDDQTNGQCKEDEYKLTKTEDGYWKYFIPLNANSADDFSFKLISSGAKEVPEMCQAYKDYYSDSWESILNMNPDGTCTFSIDVTIPVVQRFYNELEDGKIFKGFNFYYKPIDINEPFPNGLTDTSIWYEWNKDKNNPNISKSYEQLTYYANTSQNENEIRKYNNQKEYDNGKKDYPYASWEGKNENDTEGGMNKDGTSNFIDNKDIVTRRTEDFYRLGCGPKNTNVNNVFTQTECDR